MYRNKWAVSDRCSGVGQQSYSPFLLSLQKLPPSHMDHQTRPQRTMTGKMEPENKEVVAMDAENVVGANVQKDVEKKESKWDSARKLVTKTVGVSMAFSTLRQMSGEGHIAPSSLVKVKNLGEGAFAVVEQAMYEVDGKSRPVAVKRLKGEVFSSDQDLQCFFEESKLLQKLRHSAIVDFIGVGFTDIDAIKAGNMDLVTAQRNVYLVQEYMDGGTLKEKISEQMMKPRRAVYDDATAFKWLIQIAKGLRYLHNCKPKVLHRDLKCENILLKRNEFGDLDAKLADFGLHALIHEGHLHKDDNDDVVLDNKGVSFKRSVSQMDRELSVEMAYTLSGQTGSLMYMAPEVLRCENYNEKADVFSFGIITYELLRRAIMLVFIAVTGSPNDVENYAKRVAGGSRPEVPGYWPEEVADFVRKCWAPNPVDRPSMKEVVDELEGMKELIVCPSLQQTGCGCCSIQ